MYRRRILILSAFVFSLMASGCYEVSRNFSEIENEILLSAGSRYFEDTEFALGPVSMNFVKMFADDDDQEIIRNISSVQIGVYKGRNDGKNNRDLFKRINDKMETLDWKCFVRETNPDELTLIYYKNKNEKLYSMFIISINKNELSLVQLDGDLNRVILASIRQKGNPLHDMDL